MCRHKTGGIGWVQISQWDSFPDNCIKGFKTVKTMGGGKCLCSYYLHQCVKVIGNETRWRTVEIHELSKDEVKAIAL